MNHQQWVRQRGAGHSKQIEGASLQKQGGSKHRDSESSRASLECVKQGQEGNLEGRELTHSSSVAIRCQGWWSGESGGQGSVEARFEKFRGPGEGISRGKEEERADLIHSLELESARLSHPLVRGSEVTGMFTDKSQIFSFDSFMNSSEDNNRNLPL